MIPVIFIIQGKAFNKRAILCVLVCIIVLFFADQFTNVLDTLLSDTQYTNVVSDWQEWEDNGMNPIRALVYSMPTILAVIGYRYIKQEKRSCYKFCCERQHDQYRIVNYCGRNLGYFYRATANLRQYVCNVYFTALGNQAYFYCAVSPVNKNNSGYLFCGIFLLSDGILPGECCKEGKYR